MAAISIDVQDNVYYEAWNDSDENGKPAGGKFLSPGIVITWQKGPLAQDGFEKAPNGAFVDTVIFAALQRLRYYNTTEFACRENSLAITHLEEAQHWLTHRRATRKANKI